MMSFAAKVSISAALCLLAVIAAYALRSEDLADGVSWLPQCLLNELTGLHCPGCGNTRATKALLNGDVVDAWNQNAAFVMALPFLIWGAVRLWIGWVFPGKLKPLPFIWRYHHSVILIILVVAFGILRNVPVKPFSWLAPMPAISLQSEENEVPDR